MGRFTPTGQAGTGPFRTAVDKEGTCHEYRPSTQSMNNENRLRTAGTTTTPLVRPVATSRRTSDGQVLAAFAFVRTVTG